MSQVAEIRSETYAALAAAFGEPDAGFLKPPEENELLRALRKAVWGLSIPAIRGEVPELAAFLRQDTQEEERLLRLRKEYYRLFGGWGRALAYPYESSYRDPYGMLMSEYAVAVLEQYREDGIALSADFKELPDHISAELEYMAYLCAKEAQAGEDGEAEEVLKFRRRQHLFLQEHLGVWLPEFCRNVLTSADTSFYRCVGTVTKELVHWDKHQLSLSLRPPTDEVQGDGVAPAKGWRVTVDGAKCVLCESCVPVCTPRALMLEQEEEKTRLLLKASACNGCGRCERLCPVMAVAVSEADECIEPSEQYEVVARQARLHCQGCGAPFMAEALVQKVMTMLAARRKRELPFNTLLLCPECKLKRLTQAHGRPSSTLPR